MAVSLILHMTFLKWLVILGPFQGLAMLGSIVWRAVFSALHVRTGSIGDDFDLGHRLQGESIDADVVALTSEQVGSALLAELQVP